MTPLQTDEEPAGASASPATSSNGAAIINMIVSDDPTVRNRSLTEYCHGRSMAELLRDCQALEAFRLASNNLYHKVRALFFLYAIYRFHLERAAAASESDNATTLLPATGTIPYPGYQALLERRFGDAVQTFLQEFQRQPSVAVASALASAYYQLGFQTLANQVHVAVEHHHDGDKNGGNNCRSSSSQWMFQVQNANDIATHMPHIRIREELLAASSDNNNAMPVLMEQTPVRMDLSHCAWSDIFFLGMDYPEAARVLNVSVDLAVKRSSNSSNNNSSSSTRDTTQPPIETYLQVTDEAGVLRLTSIDLQSTVRLTEIQQVFDFAKDHLGLLRAGVIASGLVPPGLQDCCEDHAPLSVLLDHVIGVPSRGLHFVTKVNDIPKGSRLAVSTNLLASMIALGMRATGQTNQLTGALHEQERRLVAARAILGEWLGGSGGGWQDSGGVWPGMKLIEGVAPEPHHPEHGTSRGRLLPVHRQLSDVEAPATLKKALEDCLVLVHGGMAQNVGPVLEMVTEKYLLREAAEWKARHEALEILDDILEAFRESDIASLAELTTRNFFEPLQTIIPWASNLYTETLIERTRERFGDDFLGFWMLGGCSGGGMGFIFKAEAKAKALEVLQNIMLTTKRELEHALPFAMDPVVYDFSINQKGTVARWCETGLPKYTYMHSESYESVDSTTGESLDHMLLNLGFDKDEHEAIRSNYKNGVTGLAQNRLPMDTQLVDVDGKDVIMTSEIFTPNLTDRGMTELTNGTVGIVTLAAGVGSRWTQGAGCVKALNPFCRLGGRHRSFLEVHLAKSRRVSELAGTTIPHVITTSFMTHGPIQSYLERVDNHSYNGPIYLSRGKTIGLRLIPTVRDLRFAWEEKAQQKLDKHAQKVRESGQGALMNWAKECGEASDYRDNLPLQCLHPVGHFYEVPNLLLNGTLHKMLADRPQLKYLMLHNIDTVGADVDPAILGLFVERGSTLSFEVVPRQIHDIGGGLACVNGKARLVEGMALPREEDEFMFTFYNSMTTWIDIDKLLQKFGIDRHDLAHPHKVADAVRVFSHRLPTYVTLKDVKKRWGHGHEDVFPTAQFEKLWGDMASLDDVDCDFFVVPRERGAQLKDPAQLDGWLRDGSAKHLETLCHWDA